jgi:hypothetical protein
MVETTIVLTIVTDKTGSDFWCHETIIKILERICDIFNRPQHFQAIIVAGAFKSMRHDHEFFEHPNGTLMVDRFEFQSPFGILGRVVDRLALLPTCGDSSSAATAL